MLMRILRGSCIGKGSERCCIKKDSDGLPSCKVS